MRAITIFILAFAACGGEVIDPPTACEKETRAETFAAGLTKSTTGGYSVSLDSSTPVPLVRGDHKWTFTVTDPNGQPATGLTMDMEPFMPDHGHGTSRPEVWTEMPTPGVYEADPVNLWMAGYWEITVDVNSQADNVVYKFCID